MPLFTPIGFAAHFAQGLLNTPAEAAKGAVSLGEHIGAGNSTPQQVAGDVAAAAQLPLLFLGGGEVKSIASATESTLQTVAKALGKGVKIGAGFGALSGLQSGKNITNTSDYLKNMLTNIGIGAATGGALEGVSHVVVPLAKGLSSKLGAVFVKNVGKTPTVEHMQLAPEIAQNTVINHDLEKTPAGKEILKTSVAAQQQNAHVGITPVKEGGVALPDGQKVEVNVVKPYDPMSHLPESARDPLSKISAGGTERPDAVTADTKPLSTDTANVSPSKVYLPGTTPEAVFTDPSFINHYHSIDKQR